MGLFGKKEVPVEPVVEEKKIEGTVIAEGITFVGDFVTDENIDIKGVVKGNIVSSVDAHVSESGKHIGKMEVNTLHAEGQLESDVLCSEIAYLSDTAYFKGTLRTANLDAAHGSTFDGTLHLENNKVEVTQDLAVVQ